MAGLASSSLRLCPALQHAVLRRSGRSQIHNMAQAAGGDRLVAAATAAAARHQQALQPATSQRVLQTDAPCIVKTKKLVATTEGTLSLAQGKLPATFAWQAGARDSAPLPALCQPAAWMSPVHPMRRPSAACRHRALAAAAASAEAGGRDGK